MLASAPWRGRRRTATAVRSAPGEMREDDFVERAPRDRIRAELRGGNRNARRRIGELIPRDDPQLLVELAPLQSLYDRAVLRLHELTHHRFAIRVVHLIGVARLLREEDRSALVQQRDDARA